MGRPRIHKSDSARAVAWRNRQKKEKMIRLDGFITQEAARRLDAMVKAWNLPSRAAAIERLILEAGGETAEQTETAETAETAGAPGRQKNVYTSCEK